MHPPTPISNMTQIPHPQRQWPRGPINELHYAARKGSIERVLFLLSSGSIDINQGTPEGVTPLTIAALNGFSRIVRVLLDKGANVSITDAKGSTALHHCAGGGHSEVVGVLIEAGANPNSRRLDGGTPMYMAALYGQLDTVKVLLREGADPLLTAEYVHSNGSVVPLDAAARLGHSEVARELIQQRGMGGCGGASGGAEALSAAAGGQHVDILRMLTDAGVTDTGREALFAAALNGRPESLKFLLNHMNRASATGRAYINFRGPGNITPLLLCVWGCRQGSPRTVRLLIDAGADTAGQVMHGDTPLNYVGSCLRDKTVKGGEDATQEQLRRLEAMRRLLMQVEAVHAISWLWPKAALRITPGAVDSPRKMNANPTPLTAMLPTLRRRAGRPTVLVAALARWVGT